LESKQLYYDDRRGGSFDVFVKRDEDGKPLNETRKNNHPTVKPIALMEYLIKMITPKGGTVLDPFMGSGTTGIACKKNGFDFIGIEKQCDYFEIAMARINNAKLQQKLI
jgi:DNA modification methylase